MHLPFLLSALMLSKRNNGSQIMDKTTLDRLLDKVRSCTLCQADLHHPTRPIVQAHQRAKILIAGQAPGNKVQHSGIPFDDASGDRLREWMSINKKQFYDATKIAILPMGFCFPGTGKSGDLPPRKECAPQWRDLLIDQLRNIELTLVIGQYAMEWHLREDQKRNVTQQVLDWKKIGHIYFLYRTPVREIISGLRKIRGSEKKFCRNLRSKFLKS